MRPVMSRLATLLAITGFALALLVACGGDTTTPTATQAPIPTAVPAGTPTTEPTATPTPTPTATPTPNSAAGGLAEVLNVDIDAGTTWQELLDTLTDAERSCIRDALGGELAQTLTQTIVSEDFGEGVETEVFPCLEAETANAVFASAMIVAFQQFVGELSEHEKSCIQEAFSSLDVAAAMASGEEVPDEVGDGLVACVAPYALYVRTLLGLSRSDLSEEEKSCSREVFYGPDVAAILTSDEDFPEELIAEMISCVSQPSAQAGPPLSLDEYAAWCSELSQVSETSADEDITSAEVAEVLAAAKVVSPPGQLSDWHARYVILLRALKGLLDSETEDDSIFFLLFVPLALVQEAEDNLPADVRARLTEAGCIEPGGGGSSFEEPDLHGDDIDSATSIFLDEPVEGVLNSPDDKDSFAFDTESGQRFAIWLADFQFGSSNEPTAPFVTLYDSAGRELATHDDVPFGTRPMYWEAESAGRYILVLGDGSATGTYALRLASTYEGVVQPTPEGTGTQPAAESPSFDDHGDSVDDATPLSVGNSVEGVLDYDGDVDFFVF